ncbi:hypothetical protein X742_30770 [Mesorhizobium sp. LNHC232B00]|nr:hypothetical protein X742_30770 [Mesorhizobium sp. LNHC232B00]
MRQLASSAGISIYRDQILRQLSVAATKSLNVSFLPRPAFPYLLIARQ